MRFGRGELLPPYSQSWICPFTSCSITVSGCDLTVQYTCQGCPSWSADILNRSGMKPLSFDTSDIFVCIFFPWTFMPPQLRISPSCLWEKDVWERFSWNFEKLLFYFPVQLQDWQWTFCHFLVNTLTMTVWPFLKTIFTQWFPLSISTQIERPWRPWRNLKCRLLVKDSQHLSCWKYIGSLVFCIVVGNMQLPRHSSSFHHWERKMVEYTLHTVYVYYRQQFILRHEEKMSDHFKGWGMPTETRMQTVIAVVFAYMKFIWAGEIYIHIPRHTHFFFFCNDCFCNMIGMLWAFFVNGCVHDCISGFILRLGLHGTLW